MKHINTYLTRSLRNCIDDGDNTFPALHVNPVMRNGTLCYEARIVWVDECGTGMGPAFDCNEGTHCMCVDAATPVDAIHALDALVETTCTRFFNGEEC